MTSGAVVIANLTGEVGAALAREICAQGYATVGLSSREKDIGMAAAAAGPHFTGLLCDLADPTAVAQAFAEIRARLGPVRVLINGPMTWLRRDILDETPHSFMASINLSLGGVVACTREALADMVEQGEGRILTICPPVTLAPASVAGIVSQKAIRTFSRAVAADLADRFLRIVISDWTPTVLDGYAGQAEPEDLARTGRWGAALALSREPSLNGTAWIDDQEVRPHRGFGRWAIDWINGRTTGPRTIAQLSVAPPA
jgi:NAD(P)-dependent dehydrogenase (short-subunit alcohol dehydrogenase family)